MPGAHGGGRADLGEVGGDPAVRGEPPPRRRRPVRGVPHQRMPEPEPLGAGPHDVAGDELVQRRERRVLVHLRRRGGEQQGELVGGHGRALRDQPRVRRQPAQLHLQRRADRGRQLSLGVAGGQRLPGAGERLQVEGVAAAGPVQLAAARPTDPGAEQLGDLVLGERRHRQPVPADGLEGRLHQRAEPGRRLGGPVGEGDQHAGARRVPDEMVEQLDGRVVGPVDVVEHQHQARRRRDLLQQVPHRAVQLVAGDGRGDRRAPGPGGLPVVEGGGRQRGEHRGQQPHARGAEVADVLLQMVVEGVDDGAERHLLLELGGAPGQRAELAALRGAQQLVEQPGLARTRLADQREEAEGVGRRGVQGLLERAEDVLPSDERDTVRRHCVAVAGTTLHVHTPTVTGGRYAVIMLLVAVTENWRVLPYRVERW